MSPKIQNEKFDKIFDKAIQRFKCWKNQRNFKESKIKGKFKDEY